jgi:hypothetical protein
MQTNDDRYLILEQYRIYSDAKERFIDRQFTTNRYYLILNLIILGGTYFLTTLTPQHLPIIILCAIGFGATLMFVLLQI